METIKMQTTFMDFFYFIKQPFILTIFFYTILLFFALLYFSTNVWTSFSYLGLYFSFFLTFFIFYYASNTTQINPFYEKWNKIVHLLLVFIIIMAYFIINPGNFFSGLSQISIIFGLSILIYGIIYLIISLTLSGNAAYNTFLKYLNIVFGISLFLLFISWICYVCINYTGKSFGFSLFVNIIILLIIVILFIQTIQTTFPYKNKEKNSFFQLLKNIIFYIPCLISDVFNKIFGKENSNFHFHDILKNISNTKKTYWILFFSIFGLFVFYYFIPIIKKKIIIGNGNLIINNPISLNQQNIVGNYLDLNGGSDTDQSIIQIPQYKYAISCWFFLEAYPPNNTYYITLLDYGGKPNISYNAKLNSLKITVATHKNGNIKESFEYVFVKSNILLQKWNHLVINYTGDSCDIFMNSELVKSIPNVISYVRYDNLTVGFNGGIYGKLCSLVYYKQPLTMAEINVLYYTMKNSDPPQIKTFI